MKRFLLVSTVSLALWSPAQAQIPTIDSAAIVQLVAQIEKMKQQYTATMGIFGTLMRGIDPNSMASNLIGQQPLPGVGQIGQIMGGSGNFGSLSGLASQFLRNNTVYTPPSIGGTDFNADYMMRNGNTLAGTQAMAQQSIEAMQAHISGLTQIQEELSTPGVKTSADIEAIQARLQAEQANIAAQNTQVASLGILAQTQERAYFQQRLQFQRQAADSALAYYQGTGAETPPTSGPLGSPIALNNPVPTFNSTGP